MTKQEIINYMYENHVQGDFKIEEMAEDLAQPEVIRCKDCKFSYMTYNGECKYCDIWFPDEKLYLNGDYFCADAELIGDQMRLINADAIEYTHEITRSLDDGHNWNELCITKDEIDDMPTITQSVWIPCSERLPKEKGEYLVTYHPCYWDNVQQDIKVGIDSFRGQTSWAKKKHQRVIAWMPLSEPWKGEEE